MTERARKFLSELIAKKNKVIWFKSSPQRDNIMVIEQMWKKCFLKVLRLILKDSKGLYVVCYEEEIEGFGSLTVGSNVLELIWDKIKNSEVVRLNISAINPTAAKGKNFKKTWVFAKA